MFPIEGRHHRHNVRLSLTEEPGYAGSDAIVKTNRDHNISHLPAQRLLIYGFDVVIILLSSRYNTRSATGGGMNRPSYYIDD